jgi:hypothetical protein
MALILCFQLLHLLAAVVVLMVLQLALLVRLAVQAEEVLVVQVLSQAERQVHQDKVLLVVMV